eukprot:1067057-Pyramimonas_sp.AAC.1
MVGRRAVRRRIEEEEDRGGRGGGGGNTGEDERGSHIGSDMVDRIRERRRGMMRRRMRRIDGASPPGKHDRGDAEIVEQ